MTVACAITSLARFRALRPRFAKICWRLGLGVTAVCLLGVLSGITLTVLAAQAPGLSQADTARIWSNGLAEAFYNLAFAVIALPALLVARWSVRASSAAP